MTGDAYCQSIKEQDNKIWRLLEKYVELAHAKEGYSHVTAVGMDETSRTKGHKYITNFFHPVGRDIRIFGKLRPSTHAIHNFLDNLSRPGNINGISNSNQVGQSKIITPTVNRHLVSIRPGPAGLIRKSHIISRR